MRWLCCHSLEKGVAEHAIGFCRTMEIADPCIECRGIDDADRERLLPYGLNHPRERFPREAVDQIRCCRVNVDDPRRYGRRVIAGLHEQRIQLSADTRSEEHTSELQSRPHLVCRLLLEKKKIRDVP